MKEQDYRYENKIPLTLEELQEFRYWHKAAGIDFMQAYPSRIINNVYFDSNDLSNYYENLSGISNRSKCRLRWYGSNEPSNFQFEVKLRKNSAGFKLTQIINKEQISLNNINSLYSKLRGLLDNNLKVILDNTPCPVLYNCYLREYYAFESIRLTIDTKIKYKNIRVNSNINPQFLIKAPEGAVLEIKYPINKTSEVNHILKTIPFRINRNSKYSNGIELISL